jgi:quercetin dioxygenase-like cupin family protein
MPIGDLTVNFNNNKWNLVQGQTLLIPAAVAGFEFETSYAKLLEVYV